MMKMTLSQCCWIQDFLLTSLISLYLSQKLSGNEMNYSLNIQKKAPDSMVYP